jgi:hypothetical protein
MLVKINLSGSLKLLGFVFGLVFFSQNSFGQEEKFKALFIYNFTKYIEWPSSSRNEFKIGVLGNDNMYNELSEIAGRTKVGLKTMRITNAKTLLDVNDCEIIFISRSNSSDLAKLIGMAKSNHILLITETSNSCKQGAGLNFVLKNGSISFEVSKSNIESAGLQVNSNLLSLGIMVN